MARRSSHVTREKELGAFYTPRELADFLVRWAVIPGANTALDPSCGDGVFLKATCQHLARVSSAKARIFGIDADDAALAAVRGALGTQNGSTSVSLIGSDFFAVEVDDKLPLMDAVVGNPPYIRYQLVNAKVRERALRRAADLGVELTQLTSLWAPFVVHAASLLAPCGRLAFVLPAELLHAQYARPVRRFLLEYFSTVTVVAFDERVFPGALTEVVLLLAERGGSPARGIHVVNVRNLAALPEPTLLSRRAHIRQASGRDWSALLAPEDATIVLDQLLGTDQFVRLGNIAEVDVGCVTGDNDFFTLSKNELAVAQIPEAFVVPAVMKARDVVGVRYTRQDHAAALDAGRKGFLLVIPDRVEEAKLPQQLRDYLGRGRRLGVHEGYKCRVRRRWYSVPSTGVPAAFLTYMSNATPRLVVNDCGAWSTNTVHGLRSTPTNVAWLAASFVNTVTLFSAELAGRSYGGGVLKLEPTEAEHLIVPAPRLPPAKLAQLVKQNDALLRAGGLDELRKRNDELLWTRGDERLQLLARLYLKLRARRQARGADPATTAA
jgi:adenine-specific DNA-methyltransferase